MALTRKQRVRRVGILSLHCLRNLAFRNAGWQNGTYVREGQFWINIDGNFLDVAVTEWCKLFADKKGRHAWHKVVTDDVKFREGLLDAAGLTQADFDTYVIEVKTYRDRFVAHLDDDEVMQIPTLKTMRISAAYLYDYLKKYENDDGTFFQDGPSSSGRFYARFLKEGKAAYE